MVEKMRGALRSHQKTKIVEVVNSHLGGKSKIKHQWGQVQPAASPKRLVPPSALCYARQRWIPCNFISIYLQITHQYSHALCLAFTLFLQRPVSRGWEAMRLEVQMMGAREVMSMRTKGH